MSNSSQGQTCSVSCQICMGRVCTKSEETAEILRMFGRTFRALRERAGRSPDEMGISRSHVGQLEQGKKAPKLTLMIDLAEALDIPFVPLLEIFHREFAAQMIGMQDGTAPEIDNPAMTAWMRPDGVASITWLGRRLDISTLKLLFDAVFGYARQQNARKILLNIRMTVCDFSSHEHYLGAQLALECLRALDYWPAAWAIVRNATLSDYGAGIARKDGLRVEMFMSQQEAEQWLRAM